MKLRQSVKTTFLLAGLCLGASAQAQDHNDRVMNPDVDAKDVAMTPLRDLNIGGDGIPEILMESVMAPYASEKLLDCQDIVREIARIDVVLGPDIDLDQDERRDITAGKVARAGVASFIPFRGIIREVSGAADAERDLRAAILAGASRRGFLKGVGEARGCAYPARPATVRMTVSEDEVYEMETGQTVVTNPDGTTTTFRRGEVVQGN